MPNVLNNLIPDFYAALDVVSRELVGFIPSVQRDASADRCALGATMRSPVTPLANTPTDITPAMALPPEASQTIGNNAFTIQKARAVSFSWSGEEQMGVETGPGYLTIQQDQIAQAIRALTNEVELDISLFGAAGASRAYGTSGTAPFGVNGDLSDASQLAKILDDNGAPGSDRSLVLNTSAVGNMRGKQGSLFKVNEAGDNGAFLRQGILGDLFQFNFRQSAQIRPITAGTGAGFLINNGGGYARGATALTVDTGTGTILAGDIITIGNFKYVVAAALGANVVTIAAPGLQEAVADNAPITVNAAASRNLGFTRNAILLGTRLPALPKEGDLAVDRETIVDPLSNLAFELAVYPGYRMITYQVALAWGVKVMKAEHIATLLG